ncbi:MAG: hypothetical protein JXB24_00395 [Bacteroidales bacterium]|nr:hypothetical protein [Bacteroidales bacterium]
MKVTGFTFIRNALKYDYPVVESIQSILPVCDDFIVAVGKSEDDTLNLIRNIDKKKIEIIETIWNDNLREGGYVLAEETNKALKAVSDDTDWCFYIQGDEVVHEKYLDTIKEGMEKYKNDKNVEGLLFKYLHFYGSYDYIGESYSWYRNEIRVIRNDKKIYSFRDAQGFRKGKDEKLRVKPIDAYIFHYGWVRDPRALQDKHKNFHKLWYDDAWVDKNIAKAEEFDYSEIDALARYNGSHPKVMESRIKMKNWKFDFDISKNSFSGKEKFKRFIERLTGKRIMEYKNYKVI